MIKTASKIVAVALCGALISTMSGLNEAAPALQANCSSVSSPLDSKSPFQTQAIVQALVHWRIPYPFARKPKVDGIHEFASFTPSTTQSRRRSMPKWRQALTMVALGAVPGLMGVGGFGMSPREGRRARREAQRQRDDPQVLRE